MHRAADVDDGRSNQRGDGGERESRADGGDTISQVGEESGVVVDLTNCYADCLFWVVDDGRYKGVDLGGDGAVGDGDGRGSFEAEA